MGSGDNEFEHSTEIPAPLTRPANGDLIQVSWADDPHNFRVGHNIMIKILYCHIFI